VPREGRHGRAPLGAAAIELGPPRPGVPIRRLEEEDAEEAASRQALTLVAAQGEAEAAEQVEGFRVGGFEFPGPRQQGLRPPAADNRPVGQDAAEDEEGAPVVRVAVVELLGGAARRDQVAGREERLGAKTERFG
jgi:hypothetical protein